MKNLKTILVSTVFLLIFMSCETTTKTVGYNTYEWGKDFKFGLGSEESIQVAMNFDEAWMGRDFETMTELASDTIKFYFGNGVERSLDYVISGAKTQDSIRAADGSSLKSELKHVYSLVLDPNNGYEGVFAHFIYSYTDGDGKVNNWRQFERYTIKDGSVQQFAFSGQDIPEEDSE